MSYALIRFGTVPLPGYNSDSDIGTGRATESILDLPGGGIWDAMGENQGLQKSSTITKRLLAIADADGVIDYDTISQAHRDLRAMVGKRERLFRQWLDGTIEWCWARLSQIPAQRGSGLGGVITPLTLEFRKVSPHWYGRYRSEWVLDSEDVWGYPFRLDSGLYLDEDLVYVQVAPDGIGIIVAPNDGNAPILNAQLRVIAEIGAGKANITSFVSYGTPFFSCEWDFGQTIVFGSSLIIDNGASSVVFGGLDAYADLTFGAAHVDNLFFSISPVTGTSFSIHEVGGTATVGATLYYYEAWQ